MKNRYASLIARYLVLVFLAIVGLEIFYFIFSPLTLYPTMWILDIFYNVSNIGNMIFVNGFPIEIIGACIAGSAYSFLLILNLSIPNIKFPKRVKMVLFSFVLFFIINLIRIIILGVMYVEGSTFFDFTHKIFWFLGSTLFVVIIVKDIPV